MKLFKVHFSRTRRIDKKERISLINKQSRYYPLSVICLLIALTLIISCEKDNESESFNYDHLYDKKWLTTSQTVTPIWTYPATGKSYTDLFEFAKEIFPCVTDDYDVYQRLGVFYANHAQMRCDPNQPELAPPTYFFVDKQTDSMFLVVPLEVPGQPVKILNIRSKILELTADKMVFRYVQEVPFTNTLHTVTQTYKAIP